MGRRQRHPTPVLLPGKSHGRRCLVGCSPWDHEESDTTERLLLLFTFALEKEMATHSNVFAWRIPGMGVPGGWPSMGSHRVRHNWSDLAAAAVAVLVTQSCPTLCDPMVCSPPGFLVHGILQARILECIAISFSRGSPNPGIKARSLALQADSFTIWATREALEL